MERKMEIDIDVYMYCLVYGLQKVRRGRGRPTRNSYRRATKRRSRFGETPGKRLTLSKPNADPKSVRTPARK